MLASGRIASHAGTVRRTTLLSVAVVGGCSVPSNRPVDPPVDSQARTCPTDVSLGGDSALRAEMGPLQLDAAGVEFCVHLDPSYWTFEAYVSAAPGAFKLTLL